MSRPVLQVVRLGLVSYPEAIRIQQTLVDRVKSGSGPQTLLLCEHHPVYTIGLRTGPYPDQDLDQLRTKTGAEVHKTHRGGLITFHGPGQLVCYPIFHLGALKKGVRWYVCQLERTVIEVCRRFGISASTSAPHTGVWVQDRKICAIGIQCSRHVTSHGLALNCDVDLSWFQHIVPCGLPDRGVTSISWELNRDLDLDRNFTTERQQNITVKQAEPVLLQAFTQTFNCELDSD